MSAEFELNFNFGGRPRAGARPAAGGPPAAAASAVLEYGERSTAPDALGSQEKYLGAHLGQARARLSLKVA